jgi:LPS-assembly protein
VPSLPNRLHLAVLAALAAGPAFAAPAQNDPSQWILCANAPLFDWLVPLPATPMLRESTPADVGAAQFDVSGKDVYVLTGAAHVHRADQRLDADRLQYTHSTGQYRAEGDVRYQDRSIAIAASAGTGSLTDDQHRLDDVRYQLRSARGNGDADAIVVRGPQSDLTAVR